MIKITVLSTRILFIFSLFCATYHPANAQKLKAGFDKNEYIKLMQISIRQQDTPWVNYKIPYPENYQLIYRSPVVALDNRWDLWLSNDSIAVISIRGTTKNAASWLENFYAAMIPAKGSIQIDNKFKFDYQFSKHPQASVHVGWTIATGCLSQTMLPKIDSLYKHGIKNFVIMGHSQGGAIAYLTTAYIHYKQVNGTLPADIKFKTYCSAAPKPGNLYFAYDYESYTQDGFAYNVVNAADWVPETPVTIQTVKDFNKINPFVDAKSTIKKQKFALKIALKVAYRNLERPTAKALVKNQRFLGYKTSKIVKKTLPEFIPPTYAKTANYTRAGNYITLLGDADYEKAFPDAEEHVFIHHMYEPYLYLVDKLK